MWKLLNFHQKKVVCTSFYAGNNIFALQNKKESGKHQSLRSHRLEEKMLPTVHVVTLNQLRDILCILALIETGLEDRLVLKVYEMVQLHGAELMVVAQAEFQAVVAVLTSSGFALVLDFGSHLVERHV